MSFSHALDKYLKLFKCNIKQGGIIPEIKVDKRLVEHVANIARLKLSEQEVEKFTQQLKDVLDAFKSLDEVDTDKVNPSFHPQEISDVYREDKAEKFEWKPLANTKHKEGKYFKGPKIV